MEDGDRLGTIMYEFYNLLKKFHHALFQFESDWKGISACFFRFESAWICSFERMNEWTQLHRKTSNTYSTSFFIGFTSFYLILPHAPHAPRFISFTRFLFWAFYKGPFYTTWIFRYNFWVAAGNVWRWLCRHLRRKNLASMDREVSDRSPVRRPGSKDSHRC